MAVNSPLTQVLRNPEAFFQLDPRQMNLVVRTARRCLLLPYLAHRLAELSPYAQLPPRIQEHFTSGRLVGDTYQRVLAWEIDQVEGVLRRAGVSPVLIKGAAYLAAGLPVAAGRITADLDILVKEYELKRVEETLCAQGWVQVKTDRYDQKYYNEWMHELPPLRHRLRGTDVDVHHSILPRTARPRLDAGLLIASARPLGDGSLRVLCPEDAVLHKVVHLFYLGEFDNSLRELVDLHELLSCFGKEDGFWERLVPRAALLDLERPLYYGLRYAQRILATPIPAAVLRAARAGQPSRLTGWLMDQLIPAALLPADPDRRNLWGAIAQWFLYLRSHWLRMPPGLLARHLLTKAWMRWRSRQGPPAVEAG